jgi:hypothetical protein
VEVVEKHFTLTPGPSPLKGEGSKIFSLFSNWFGEGIFICKKRKSNFEKRALKSRIFAQISR